MGSYSSLLYADPSFLEGMARLFDFADTLTEFNRSLSGEQADVLALAADWQAVAEDMLGAIALVMGDLSNVDPEDSELAEPLTERR